MTRDASCSDGSVGRPSAAAREQCRHRGSWKVRGEPKQFTSSKMFCWVACERGARLADIREDFEQARLINAMMHVIRAEEHVALGR